MPRVEAISYDLAAQGWDVTTHRRFDLSQTGSDHADEAWSTHEPQGVWSGAPGGSHDRDRPSPLHDRIGRRCRAVELGHEPAARAGSGRDNC